MYIGVYLHFYVGVHIYFFLGGGTWWRSTLSLSLSVYIYIYREREREREREWNATRSPKIRGFKRFLTILCFLNVEKRGPDSVPFWIYIYIYIYIYIQKGTLSGPPFSTFLEMQCFCYIMFSPLCSYTCAGIARDPHRLSDFLRGCQRMSRES